MNICIKKRHLLYDFSLTCWIIYSIISGATTIPLNIYIEKTWYFICIILLCINLLKNNFNRLNIKNIIIFISGLTVVLLSSFLSNYKPLIAWYLLVVNSIDVEHRHVVNIFWKAFLAIGVIVPILAILEVIPNTVLNTVNTQGVRSSYGFTHPNVFSVVILVLILCWCYLHWQSVNLGSVVIINFIAIFISILTDSFASFICIVFISVVAMLERLFDKRGKIKIWYYITFALLISSPIISYFLMINYSSSDMEMIAIDTFTTGRLKTMNAFYEIYGWRWFGQNVIFDTVNRSLLLFALDNSYAYLLINFGPLISILYFAGIARIIAKAVQCSDNRLIICVMTYIVYGLFENYFFKVQFNFTLLFILSSRFEIYTDNIVINGYQRWRLDRMISSGSKNRT